MCIPNRITKIEVTENLIRLNKLKKQYLKMFQLGYVGIKQFHLTNQELQALNLVYFLTKKKKIKNLKNSFEVASKKFNVDILHLKSLWSSRMNHMRHAKDIIQKIFDETYEIKKD